MKKSALLFTTFVLLAMIASSVSAAPAAGSGLPSSLAGQADVSVSPSFIIPTFSITSVDVDKTVSIKTANFPSHQSFDVLMNTYGTLGKGGTKVDSVDSGAGGTLTFTFDIPDSLKGLKMIAIRLESTTSKYYSYNWFYNNTATTPSSGGTSGGSTEVVPVFWIEAVEKDDTVTIETTSLSAGYTYDVYMNTYGTLGVGGTKVDTIDTGSGGVKTYTFTIPSDLHGLSKIAIRLQSPTTGYFGYNWFWNSTYP